jgi:hypothetical protein
MKFIHYINESDVNRNQEFIETIKKDCGPYLEDSKNSSHILARYTKNNIVGIKLIVPRTDRRPMDTPIWMHNYIDDALKKRFKWKPRSEGVFAITNDKKYFDYKTKNLFNAYSYYPIFPIGKYEYLWSPTITDLYLSSGDVFRKYDINWRQITTFPKNEDMKQEFDAIMDTYKNDNIESFLNMYEYREIMIKCKSYYMVSAETAMQIIPELYK